MQQALDLEKSTIGVWVTDLYNPYCISHRHLFRWLYLLEKLNNVPTLSQPPSDWISDRRFSQKVLQHVHFK